MSLRVEGVGQPRRWPDILGREIQGIYVYQVSEPRDRYNLVFHAAVLGSRRAMKTAELLSEGKFAGGIPTAEDMARIYGSPPEGIGGIDSSLGEIYRIWSSAVAASELPQGSDKPVSYKEEVVVYRDPDQPSGFFVRTRHDRILGKDGFPSILAESDGSIITFRDDDSPNRSYNALVTVLGVLGIRSPKQAIDNAIQNKLYHFLIRAIGEGTFDNIVFSHLVETGLVPDSVEDPGRMVDAYISQLSAKGRLDLTKKIIGKLGDEDKRKLANTQERVLNIRLVDKVATEDETGRGTLQTDITTSRVSMRYNSETSKLEVPDLLAMKRVEVHTVLTSHITDRTTHDGLRKLRDRGTQIIGAILEPFNVGI